MSFFLKLANTQCTPLCGPAPQCKVGDEYLIVLGQTGFGVKAYIPPTLPSLTTKSCSCRLLPVVSSLWVAILSISFVSVSFLSSLPVSLLSVSSLLVSCLYLLPLGLLFASRLFDCLMMYLPASFGQMFCAKWFWLCGFGQVI